MSNVLFVTDLDGTLLDHTASVPEACLHAIYEYTQRGGLFSVCTGRPTRGVFMYPALTELINAPIITYNGACIYDAVAKKTIRQYYVPSSVKPIIETALKMFPSLGLLVFSGENDFTCAIRENAYTREVTETREHYHAPECAWSEVPPPWNKLVLAGPAQDISACAAYVMENTNGEITALQTEGIFLEIVKSGISKGVALETLSELLAIPQQNVVAIGDSVNDISMLQWAGTGVAVANAEEKTLQAADVTVASNDKLGFCACLERCVLPLMNTNQK